METLKDLHYKVQSASLKERKEVIENVIHILTNPGKYLILSDTLSSL